MNKITAKCMLASLLLTGGLDQSAGVVQPQWGFQRPLSGTARVTNYVSLPGDSVYEVMHYRLDLTIPLVTSALSGTVTMTCRSLTNNLDQVLLDLDTAVVVSAASMNSLPITPVYNAVDFKLVLPLSQTVGLHDNFTLVVEYTAAPSNNGFYKHQMSAYTDWAAGWFPCHDFPWDKATFDLHITVPKGVEVGSVGRLGGRVTSGDGLWETFNWHTDYPVATHLVGMMMSSYYCRWSDWYVAFPTDSIEIVYYVFQRDSALAARDFVHIVEAMDFFATMIGPYPFEKYGMAEVEPLYYGGMEYQTLSMITSKWIRGDATAEDGFVHELAHQWWGDAVGFTNWLSLWLSEGFAEYSAALFTEHQYGEDAFRASMEMKKSRYLQQAVLLDYSIATPIFDYSHIPIVYKKGAWVLHMLRHVVGNDNFWLLLRDYFQLYQYSNATISQFQAVAEDVSRQDLTWFFDQWICNVGYPIIDATCVTTETAGGEYRCDITLRQVQTAGPVFSMPLDLRLVVAGGQLDTTVWLNSSPQSFVVMLPGLLQGLEVDPLDKMLLEIGTISPVVDVESVLPRQFLLFQNYPNPFNPSTAISYQLPVVSDVKLVVYDLLGREVATLVNAVDEPGLKSVEWNAAGVSSGVYFYRLQAGDFIQTRKLLLLR